MRIQEIFINLLLVLEACIANLLPDTLLNDLATESIIDGRVEKREPDAPLAFGRFGSILLVPNTVGSLVCKIHLCVKMAITIPVRLEGDSLREVVVNGWQFLSADDVVKRAVVEVLVVVELPVGVRSELLELWLFTFVHNVHCVGGIVEVLVPVDAQVVFAGDVLPVGLVLFRQLRRLLCLATDDGVHDLGREAAHDYHDDAGHQEADGAVARLFPLFDFDLPLAVDVVHEPSVVV